MCDYMQGRCPYHTASVNIPTIKLRLHNLINFFNRQEMNHPDPKLHRNISFVKSLLRIVAGVSLCSSNFVIAGIMLVLAEVLGVAEELV